MAYPLDDSIVAGQANHIADHQQMHKRYNLEGPKVKADFGAVGDSNHNTAGGTDDTTAFQNAIDAVSSSNTGVLLVEAGTYRITSPLKMFKADGTGGNIRLIGLSNRNNATLRGPTLVYDGPTDGTPRAMLDYDTPNSNIAGCPIVNIALSGGNYVSNASAIRYRKKVDLHTDIDSCNFTRWSGPSILYDLGCTNGYIYRSRWDEVQGFAIHLKLDTSQSFFGVKDVTFASNQSGQMGFLYVERDDTNFNSKATINLENLNIEVQNHLAEVEAGGTNPADRRGLFQFKATAAHGSLQYRVNFTNIRRDGAGGLNSFSIFLMRGDGTAAQRGRRISITGTGLTGLGGGDGTAATGAIIPLGNVASAQQPGAVTNAIPQVNYRSTNTELQAAERPVPWTYEGAD